MINITDIINTINGPVEVRTKATTHQKTQETKIVVTVVRHSDPAVTKMTASITTTSTQPEAIEIGKQQARNRLANKINAYYLSTLPTDLSMMEMYMEKLEELNPRNISHGYWHHICPANWRAANTCESHLKYFSKHYLEILSDAVAKNAYGPSVDEKIRSHILDEVKAQIKKREGGLPEEELISRAQHRANDHIAQCNMLYAAFRLELPNYLRYPEVNVPYYNVLRLIKPEQCKALDWEVMITLAALLRLCAKRNPIAIGGILMLCSLLRTAEATAPTFGDIVFCGDFAVYGVLWQSDGSVRIADLKTDSAYRLVIIPKFGVDSILERMEQLCSAGFDENMIKKAYVVSDPEDPFRPANPDSLSALVRKLMTEIGCSAEFWAAADELMRKEPDALPTGKMLFDLTCYVLRRSGCTYLCNCSGLDMEIVDVIMGHLLRREDADYFDEIKREEIWAKVADHLECIVLDPNHSAHPAFAPKSLSPVNPTQVPRLVAHTSFQLRITEEMIKSGNLHLLVQTLEPDDIQINHPAHTSIKKAETIPVVASKDAPCILERLSPEAFEQYKAVAEEIFKKLYPDNK